MSNKTDSKKDILPKVNLLKYYTFDNYVTGENNNFALAFAKAVSDSPGTEYNPLFIYSTVGLGKTHLLNAIGNAIIEKDPKKKVLYIPAHQFEADLVDAIQFNRLDIFREEYSNLDVLMVDDIQFIASKESAQNEFFHAFNELFNSGKQIVLSSDRPPSALSTLEQRLRSRFEGGIITEVLCPDIETRKAILHQKIAEKGESIPDNVIDFLCQSIKDDIRKLEGALKETLAFSKLSNKTITIDIAKQVITQKLSQKKTSAMGLADINKEIDQHNIPTKKEPSEKEETNTQPNEDKKPSSRPKINLSLPPSVKKKESMIRMASKNISLTDDNEEKPAQEKNNASLKDKQTVLIQENQESSIDDQESTEKIKASLEKKTISLTSAFSNQTIQQLVEKKKTPSTPPATPQTTTENENTDPNRDVPLPESPKQPSLSEKISLTNIFSSHDIKEKINKIIAVGNETNNESPNAILGTIESPNIRNDRAFSKEHKKKLHFELKKFDTILKKINTGQINIYYFDAVDDFTENLEMAHIANKNARYQEGLDHIRNVKKAFEELTANTDGTDHMETTSGSALSYKTIITLCLLGIGGIIVAIIWFILFGNI